MSKTVASRQHAVNQPVRPSRTKAGDRFTDLVLHVVLLSNRFTAIGEALAGKADQTLARWVILDAIEDGPATVAQIARRRGIARQAVQRVADLLVRDGLAAYEPNPEHRRAKLVVPTAAGQASLRTISIAQKAWADAMGAEIGVADLEGTSAVLERTRRALSEHPLPE